MFIGREQELQQLQWLYQTGTFGFAVLHGRRRIGKTALIHEFNKRKEVLYFPVLETSASLNLACLKHILSQKLRTQEAIPDFTSLEEALGYLFELSCRKRFVLVLDNYPNLIKTDKRISFILADLIHKYEGHTKLFLLLSGTTNVGIEQQFLLSKGPLYGIPDLIIHLQPLDFFECRKFFRSFSAIDLAKIYGIVGGVPHYWKLINERLSVEENMKELFLSTSSPLFEEPALILRQEVREPALYNAILSAIANGANKLSSIAAMVGEETSACATYLKPLLALGIVRKESPVADASLKKTIYRIHDPLFRFWYRFLPECINEISQEQPAQAFHLIQPHLTEYMNDVFEEICRQYLYQLSQTDKLPSPVKELGCWWGVDPFTKEPLKIDILALTEDADTALFGSCFWDSPRVNERDLYQLLEQSSLFSYTKKHYYLFAKNGFSRECYDLANELQTVTLVSFSK